MSVETAIPRENLSFERCVLLASLSHVQVVLVEIFAAELVLERESRKWDAGGTGLGGSGELDNFNGLLVVAIDIVFQKHCTMVVQGPCRGKKQGEQTKATHVCAFQPSRAVWRA